MICKRCGAPLEAGQRFCAKCGTAVEAPGPDTAATPLEAPATVAAPTAPPPRKRHTGLWAGLAAAAVAVILLLALGVPALLRAMNPAVYLFDSLVNTGEALAGEQAALRENLGLDLPTDKADSTIRLQLDELPLAGPEADLLQGLGLTLRTRTDLEARQVQYTWTLGMGDLSLLSVDAWADDQQLAVSSPELTDGAWYGLPVQGFGAQINRLAGYEAVDPAMELDLFDAAQSLSENGSVLQPKTEETLWDATRALLDEVELEREKNVTVNAQGRDRKLDRVTVSATREALNGWLNACADALLADPYLASIPETSGLSQEEFRQALNDTFADLPDTLQLVFLVQNKQVVRLSIPDTNGAEAQFELGMDGVLSDTLAFRVLDGNGAEGMAFVISGAHTAPDGHLTSSGRLTYYDQVPLTFMLDLDAKQTADNLTAELQSADGWGATASVRVQGSWAADPGAHTLTVDLARLEFDADGTAIVFSGGLTMAPGEAMTGPDETPILLSEMSDQQLADLATLLETNLQFVLYQALLGMTL